MFALHIVMFSVHFVIPFRSPLPSQPMGFVRLVAPSPHPSTTPLTTIVLTASLGEAAQPQVSSLAHTPPRKDAP